MVLYTSSKGSELNVPPPSAPNRETQLVYRELVYCQFGTVGVITIALKIYIILGALPSLTVSQV